MKHWSTSPKVTCSDDLYQIIGGNKLVTETLVRRGLTEAEYALGFLDPNQYSPRSPFELQGMDKGIELLINAIRNKRNILVWGDFDVDGQTSTTILTSALQQLGSNVKHYIPVRATESHGIHLGKLKNLIKAHNIDLLLTCDTGIAENIASQYAMMNGVKVIITDHHQIPPNLPPADTIINPRFLPTGHPLASLPGVGVAYKLIEALCEHMQSDINPEQFLDLVALGIVADVAELVWDTRYLLQLGIQKLQNTQRTGLLALFDQADIIQTRLDEELIAFGIAPRLNALGRLSDANLIVEFLTTDDRIKARTTAIELEALNARRKLLTDQVTQGALALIDREPNQFDQPVLILSHPEWPSGVLGIVASRLVDYFHKPVILLTAPPNEIARGSARSITGINITDLIKEQSHLLVGFGGHPMAAGLSLEPDNIIAFQNGISQSLLSSNVSSEVKPPITIDSWVSLENLTVDFIQDINRLAPFGSGNNPIVFGSKNLKVEKSRLIGRYNEHRLVGVNDKQGNAANVLWWQSSIYPLPEGIFDLAFTVRSVDYRGQADIQISWIDSRPSENAALELSTRKNNIQITIDLRYEKEPENNIENYLNKDDVAVWAEGLNTNQVNWKTENRRSLSSANTLIIWTIPPGIEELQNAINIVNPVEIIFFAEDPKIDEPYLFINRLLGLIKYSIRTKNGNINLEELAVLTSQRITTIETAIQWLSTTKIIDITHVNEYNYIVHHLNKEYQNKIIAISQDLVYLLQETAAFRKFYCRTDIKTLLVTEK